MKGTGEVVKARLILFLWMSSLTDVGSKIFDKTDKFKILVSDETGLSLSSSWRTSDEWIV